MFFFDGVYGAETDFAKYGYHTTGGTVVKAGRLTVATSGAQGNGPLTVYGGATLAYTVVIGHPYPLILNAGTTLKPTQNAYIDVSESTVSIIAAG